MTLKNEGDSAYRPKFYGSKITIERKILKDGVSHYRILNEKGFFTFEKFFCLHIQYLFLILQKEKLVETKKSEVDNIVEQFNIQVDNPVCFLNQETSKHFLNSSDNVAKYRLFMKATQLEAMREIHELITKERESAIQMITAKSEYMPVLEQEVFEWEEKYKKCRSVDKLNQDIVMLYKESAWANVIAREKRVEEIERDIGKIDREIEKNERKIEEATRRISESDERRENNAQKIARLTLEADSYEAHREELSGKYKEATAAYKATNLEIKKTKVGKKSTKHTLFLQCV